MNRSWQSSALFLYLLVLGVAGAPPKTIQTMPRLSPTDDYHEHMENVMAAANEKAAKRGGGGAADLKKAPTDAPSKETHNDGYKSSTSQSILGGTHGDRAGFVFGFGFITMVITMALFYTMMQSKTVLRKHAYNTVDLLIAAFLAGLWVDVFESYLDFYNQAGIGRVAWTAVHALVVLVIVELLAMKTLKHQRAHWILTTIGTKYCIFNTIQFSSTAHDAYFTASPLYSLLGVGVLLGVYMVGLLILSFTQRKGQEKEYKDFVEDTEETFAAIGIATVWGVTVRAAIAGEVHHLEPEIHETHASVGAMEKWMLLAYGLCMVPTVAFVTRQTSEYMKNHPDMNVWGVRAIKILNKFLGMTMTFAFIMWGDWEFKQWFHDSQITCGLAWGLASTLIGAAGVYALSKINAEEGSQADACRDFLVGCVGFFMATGWLGVSGHAIEDFAKSYAHPHKCRLILTFMMFVIITPPWLLYFKPEVDRANKEDVEVAGKS